MEFKEVTQERKFTLGLDEREAGILKNLLGECGGDCKFIQNLYDTISGAGVEGVGRIEGATRLQVLEA